MLKFPLLKNAIREIKTQALQFCCCFVLITCGIAIFAAINLGVGNISYNFNKIANQSKLHQFSLQPGLNGYSSYQLDKNSPLYKSYCEPNGFNDSKSCIWNLWNNDLNKQYNYESSQFNVYTFQQIQKNSVKFFQLTSTQTVLDLPFETNSPYNTITNIDPGNCYVNKEWAANNNVTIGNSISLLGKLFKVVGFGMSPINLYPIIPPNAFPDAKNNAFIILNPQDLTSISQSNQKVGRYQERIVAKFNDKLSLSSMSSKIAQINEDLQSVILPSFNNTKPNIVNETYSNSGYKGETNIFYILLIIRNDKLLSTIFIGIILIASSIIIFIVLKRRVEDSRKKIGILKSLGYKNNEIAWSYTMFTLVVCIASFIVGFIVGFFLQYLITTTTETSMPMATYFFNVQSFLLSFLIPTIILTSLSYFFSYMFVKKNTISLIRGDFQYKARAITKKVSLLSQNWSFKHKFSVLMASKSVGKIATIFITIIITSFLTIFTLTAASTAQFFVKNIEKSMNYNYNYLFNEGDSAHGYYQSIPEYCLTNSSDASCKFDTATTQNVNNHFTISAPTEISETDIVALSSKILSGNFSETDFNGNYLVVTPTVQTLLLAWISQNASKATTPKAKEFLAAMEAFLNSLNVSSGSVDLTFGFIVYDPAEDYSFFSLPMSYAGLSEIDTVDNATSFIPAFTPNILNSLTNYVPPQPNEIPVYVSQYLANKNRLKTGDTFDLRFGGYKAVILGIVDNNLQKVTYTTKKWLNEYMKKYPSTLQNITNNHYDNNILSKSNTFKYPSKYFPLYFHGSANNLQINMALYSYIDVRNLFVQIGNKIQQLDNIIWIFIGVATFINLIILISISALIITENQVFISIMKVLGYHDREISILFAKIYAPFIALGFLVAIPLVFGISLYLTNSLSSALNFNFPFTPSIWQIFIGFAIITVLTLISYKVGNNLIKKIGYLRTINSE